MNITIFGCDHDLELTFHFVPFQSHVTAFDEVEAENLSRFDDQESFELE
jgi:hypothetical protein